MSDRTYGAEEKAKLERLVQEGVTVLQEIEDFSITFDIFGTTSRVGFSSAKNLILLVPTTSALSTNFAYLRKVFSDTPNTLAPALISLFCA